MKMTLTYEGPTTYKRGAPTGTSAAKELIEQVSSNLTFFKAAHCSIMCEPFDLSEKKLCNYQQSQTVTLINLTNRM